MESYTTTLRPTGLGEAIRSQGDIPGMGQAAMGREEPVESYTSSLRPTGQGQAIRETGTLASSASGSGLQLQPEQDFDEQRQRRSVRNLVQKFRSIEVPPAQGGDVPAPYAQSGRSPVVLRRQQQQQQQQFRQQQPQQQPLRAHEAPAGSLQHQHPPAPHPMTQARNRSSMMDCLSFDSIDCTQRTGFRAASNYNQSSSQQQQQTQSINDPSAILGGNLDDESEEQQQQQQQERQQLQQQERQQLQQQSSKMEEESPVPKDPGETFANVGAGDERASSSLKERFAQMLADLDQPVLSMPFGAPVDAAAAAAAAPVGAFPVDAAVASILDDWGSGDGVSSLNKLP